MRVFTSSNEKKQEKQLLMAGYLLNALVSIVWPIVALITLSVSPYASDHFLTHLFGFTVLAAMSVSLLSNSKGLYVLNIFSGVLFLNAFIASHFSVQFIHMHYIVYAVLTCVFYACERKVACDISDTGDVS